MTSGFDYFRRSGEPQYVQTLVIVGTSKDRTNGKKPAGWHDSICSSNLRGAQFDHGWNDARFWAVEKEMIDECSADSNALRGGSGGVDLCVGAGRHTPSANGAIADGANCH